MKCQKLFVVVPLQQIYRPTWSVKNYSKWCRYNKSTDQHGVSKTIRSGAVTTNLQTNMECQKLFEVVPLQQIYRPTWSVKNYSKWCRYNKSTDQHEVSKTIRSGAVTTNLQTNMECQKLFEVVPLQQIYKNYSKWCRYNKSTCRI
ncbi:hypothetical protein ACJMK2_027585 [Sinanodonta woodiana]|uniref:Uncharacterized protein n=1 Tax=Sinanodonta woodiana TaxID=1069815 RepID=A0ABD3X507_SINWO